MLVSSGKSGDGARFLLASGLVSLFLGLDDAFLIHEEVLGVHLQLSQSLVYGIYILIISAYLFLFLKTVLGTDFLLLILAAILLGASVGIDAISDHYRYTENLATFIEDLLKFLGIIFWLGYQARASAALIRAGLRHKGR